MTEAVKRAVQYAFDEMEVELLTVFHVPHNVRSKRVIEKCGFSYEATIEQGLKNYDGRLFDSVIYSIIKSDSFVLVQPSSEHEKQYQDMMDEWEAHQAQYGGWFNPGALRRYSNSQKKTVTYAEWLKWIDDDRKAGQELYFFMRGEKVFGAISIRPKKNAQNIGIDGHCGFGIRPTERKKGYAAKMLSMALPIMKNHGINPVVITCDKANIGSAKVIQNNGGVLVDEVMGEKSGNPVQIYNINLYEG
jgi:predicted acetyltransferase